MGLVRWNIFSSADGDLDDGDFTVGGKRERGGGGGGSVGVGSN